MKNIKNNQKRKLPQPDWEKNSEQRGQKNPKWGKTIKRKSSEGLQGHNENDIGHRKAR